MIHYKKNKDDIVTLTFDKTDRNINVINHKTSQAFVPILEHLKNEKEKGALQGVIITSAKKTFLAGGDLEYLQQITEPQELFNFIQSLQHFFRALERPGVPVVAAINGTALGTGFELALACHHRIAIDYPKTRLGFPEVNLGLMPASGGVIRLLWLLGFERAFPILIEGKRYNPKEALKVGIIDELAKDEEEMMEKAKRWLLNNPEGRRPWDQENETIPGGTAADLELNLTIQRLSAELSKNTYNNFPAQRCILNTLVEGSKVDFDTACRIESRNVTALMQTKESHNMIKAFWFDRNAIRAGEQRPKGFGKFRPKKIGVIGAGRMGSGIALTCLLKGMEVVMKDISKAVAQRGKEYVEKKLEELIEAQIITADKKEKLLAALITTETSEDFKECDLVIEAVFENKMVKTKVTREAERHMDEYSLFASNTSSILISDLAKGSLRAQNFVGLHFFDPVDKVPLVEIVKGEQTSDETIARAFDFVNHIRKTPIIVKDSWGFYASRVRNTYILEGIIMLQEGYPPALIENLGLQSGMPKGPLAWADDLSLEMVLRYENQAAVHYGPKYIQHPAVETLNKMLEDIHRFGANKKEGFYEYNDGQKRKIWKDLTKHFQNNKKDFSAKELIERFMFVQVIEAVWCLQEGIIKSVPEANLGSIYGWGFPSFKGGAIQYINDYGLKDFIKKCDSFKKSHGPRFKAPSLIRKKSYA